MKNYLSKVGEVDQTVNPLFQFLGVIVEEISPEKSVLRLPLKYHFRQGAGITAGGILATLADEAMAHVVLANLDEGQTTTTIEMNMRYLRSIKEGEIRAVARVIKKGRQIITVTAEIRDEKSLVVYGGASFMVLQRK
jgi:uncharacterized protein (TIGR00369 family)